MIAFKEYCYKDSITSESFGGQDTFAQVRTSSQIASNNFMEFEDCSMEEYNCDFKNSFINYIRKICPDIKYIKLLKFIDL